MMNRLADSLFAVTDLNNWPSVHVALQQMSLEEQFKFLHAALATDPENEFFIP